MADTTFVDKQTLVPAPWLNDVNDATYNGTGVFTPAGTGAVATTNQSKLREQVSITDFGAVGDWNGTTGTDNYPAIQAAINYLFSTGGGTLLIPQGFYRVSQPLNLTGNGTTGRFGNTPIVIRGEGMPNAFDTGSWSTYGGSWIIGQTGTWIMDCTGMQYLTVEELGFRGTGTGASNKGILCARSTDVKFAHSQTFRKVVVWIDTFPASTSVGSIAIANNGAETYVIEQSWLIADTPLTLTFNNNQDLNLVSPYVSIEYGLGYLSTTMLNFRNTTFQALTGYATRLQGILNADFDTCIWSAVAGNTTNHGIQFVAGQTGTAHNQDIRMTGQVENFPGAIRIDDAEIWNIDLNLMLPSPTAAYISTGGVIMNNFKANLHHAYGSTPQPVFNCSSSSQLNGGQVDLYAGGTITSNTNLITNGAVFKGNNLDLTGALGLGGGSTYLSSGIGGTVLAGPAGLAIVPNGANNCISSAAPNVATSYLLPDGVVQLCGVFTPNGATTIAAGVAAGTIAVAHRPNREVNGICYVAGTIYYLRVLTTGQVILGGAVVGPGQVGNIDGMSYKLTN